MKQLHPTPSTARTAAFLDRSLEDIDSGRIDRGLDLLYEGVIGQRATSSPEQWRAFVKEFVAPHPVTQRIHLDPIAWRSYSKPRGYAGDAVLLDYIYGLRTPESGEHLAQAIYGYGRNRPACMGVRRRREAIADWIDRTAAERGRPLRVLSIASGHLREAELSEAFCSGQVTEYIALDSDGESCALVSKEKPGVSVRHAPFTELYRSPDYSPRFDLIYSAGLYDYLEDRVAAKLTRRLFELLAHGGRLLLTNFLTSNADSAYMEAFMDWHLLYRDLQQVQGFADLVPDGEIHDRRAWTDAHLAVGYLELQRG